MPTLDTNGQARQALREVLAGYGPAALDDTRLMTSLLSDLLAGSPREARVLVAAASVGTGRLLGEHIARGMPVEAAIRDVTAVLAADSLIDQGVCQWVVTEYAQVLGHVTAAPAATRVDTAPVGFTPSGSGPALQAAPTSPASRIAPSAAAPTPAARAVPGVTVTRSRAAVAARATSWFVVGAVGLAVLLNAVARIYLIDVTTGTAFLILLGFGCCALLGRGFYTLAAAARARALRVGPDGVAILFRNPAVSTRLRTAAWVLTPIVVGVPFVIIAMVYAGYTYLAARVFMIAAFAVALLVGIVTAVIVTNRSRPLRTAWVGLRYAGQAVEPGPPVAVLSYAWADVTGIAVQPIGLLRRSALVATLVPGQRSEWARFFERPAGGADAVALADLGRLGIRSRDVMDALHAYSGGRLRPVIV